MLRVCNPPRYRGMRSLDSVPPLGMTLRSVPSLGMTLRSVPSLGMTLRSVPPLGMTLRSVPPLEMTVPDGPPIPTGELLFVRPDGPCHPDQRGGISSLMIREPGKPGKMLRVCNPPRYRGMRSLGFVPPLGMTLRFVPPLGMTVPDGPCHPDQRGGISSLMIRESGKPGKMLRVCNPPRYRGMRSLGFVPPLGMTLRIVPPLGMTYRYAPPLGMTLRYVPLLGLTLRSVPPLGMTFRYAPPLGMTLRYVPPPGMILFTFLH